MILRPDDDVYRVDAVWLGPKGMTLPWSARYSAYGIWIFTFLGILTVEAILPMDISIPPVWELVISILATYALTGVIDHDRPVGSVLQLVVSEVRSPRAHKQQRPKRIEPTSVRFRERNVPQAHNA